ncbi:MAG TPA: pyridoxamine 5'-phosphate oxidase family protein [Candidatus Saccharimonadales bacterium]|nr:pyridoxamine 5'-phosphate oxidase family protein [Candidatus Saccharimonadales bacterium]
MDVEQAIRDYLPTVIHMSLATCVDNKPWVCEVHFVYDNDLNLYWRSTPDRRHSQEIAKNPNVAGNIIEQHGESQKPRGLYFEGRAEQVAVTTEDDHVYKLFVERFGKGPEILDNPHNFYKVNVADWYLFDARDSDPAQKYHLDRGEGKNE